MRLVNAEFWDLAYFARARLDLDTHTVIWLNGADTAPDFLYEMEPEAIGPEMNI